jgi:hypothetical protein
MPMDFYFGSAVRDKACTEKPKILCNWKLATDMPFQNLKKSRSFAKWFAQVILNVFSIASNQTGVNSSI